MSEMIIYAGSSIVMMLASVITYQGIQNCKREFEEFGYKADFLCLKIRKENPP